MQRFHDAAVKGVQIKSSKEECALGMGQRSSDAAARDAQIKPSKVECVWSMGQRSNAATKKDAQIKPSKEECALGTEQRWNDETAEKVAQRKSCQWRIGAKMKLCCIYNTYWGQRWNYSAFLRDLIINSSVTEYATGMDPVNYEYWRMMTNQVVKSRGSEEKDANSIS